jgi:hypothetical protein
MSLSIERTKMSELLSMEGRYNRAKYFWTQLVIQFIAQVSPCIIGLAVKDFGGNASAVSVLGGIAGILGAVIGAFPVVKRLLACCILASTKWTIISPWPSVAWQTNRQRYLPLSVRAGVVRAHTESRPA